MAVVTMKNLLESGVHFGHQVKRWDPRMKKYIFAERNGIHIIGEVNSLCRNKKTGTAGNSKRSRTLRNVLCK